MKKSEVAFVYRLTGVGWSQAQFRIGDVSVELSASYLDDALGDLVRAVAALSEAESTVRVSWAEEPGEYRWLFDRSGDRVAVRVLEFAELWGGRPDEDGRVLIDAECSLVALRIAVATAARDVLAEWGEGGYRAKWVEHDFPTTALLALEVPESPR